MQRTQLVQTQIPYNKRKCLSVIIKWLSFFTQKVFLFVGVFMSTKNTKKHRRGCSHNFLRRSF